MSQLRMSSHYAAADSPLPHGPEWIESQWRAAELKAGTNKPVLLVLDEIQKVRGWSETLKRLWDESVQTGNRDIRLLVLGSSALLLQAGLTESLAGRFFLNRCTHWSFSECREAFGWSLDQWLFFGGYPGSAPFVEDEQSWKQYVADSLIETVLARDVLQMQKITKPVLLRHLFALAASYPAQILSYNKMLGQLTDAGNTTTLAHYLRVLESAFMVSGLEKLAGSQVRSKGSSPKLILWNNALVNALSLRSLQDSLADSAWRGRLVENAVGAHLLNGLPSAGFSVGYWRNGQKEIDFVVSAGKKMWGIEVKSGRTGRPDGVEAFCDEFPKAKVLLVGSGGIPLEDFFLHSEREWLM